MGKNNSTINSQGDYFVKKIYHFGFVNICVNYDYI
jgi:hypothetical protein